MSAKIDGNRLMTRRKMRHLRIPVGACAGEAMHEYDRRLAAACYDMMNDWHLTHPIRCFQYAA